MSSSLTDIRNGLATVLAQQGLQVYPVVSDVVNTPAVVVDMAQNPSITFTNAFNRGSDEYYFDLLIFVANTDTKNAQTVLDQYVTGKGTKSIREALWTNSNLGLADVDSIAMNVKSYGGSPEVAGIKMIGAIMRVCVTVT